LLLLTYQTCTMKSKIREYTQVKIKLMSKKTLIIAFSFLVSLCSAQQDIYKKVSAFIKQNHPEIITQSKLLVINFANEKAYSSLEKTATIYGSAKLKGGRNGAVCVTIVKDTDAEIALNKQGYKNMQVINGAQLGSIDPKGLDNITFSSNGEVIFQDLEPHKIYEAINQLITR
jgi:hypothetical protein